MMKIFKWTSSSYFLIGLIAIALDLFVYGSGGAVSLATLATAAIAMICFLAGPFSRGTLSKSLFASWLVGAVLVIAGLAYIGMYGEAALKDGELIFTYAMLILAPPASFLLPLVSGTTTTTGFAFMTVLSRSLITWIFCIFVGVIQWAFVSLLVEQIRHRFLKK